MKHREIDYRTVCRALRLTHKEDSFASSYSNLGRKMSRVEGKDFTSTKLERAVRTMVQCCLNVRNTVQFSNTFAVFGGNILKKRVRERGGR